MYLHASDRREDPGEGANLLSVPPWPVVPITKVSAEQRELPKTLLEVKAGQCRGALCDRAAGRAALSRNASERCPRGVLFLLYVILNSRSAIWPNYFNNRCEKH